MAERIRKWFTPRAAERPFEALQIEVTSRCNLRCVMCPVTVLADGWPAVDLPWETFQRIAQAFEKTKWVYLQGWGEPLLHPRLFDMIAVAKGAGCRVGFTTNGTRLTRQAGERLLDLQLDLLAVSIAGATSTTHEAIRVGSTFQRLVGTLRRFLALKAERRSELPKVELLFLMTRTNLAELPRGEQTLQGVKFKVGDGLIHLAGRFAPKRPEKVEGIAVGGRAEALYFLHATGWGQGEPGADTYVADGTVIGRYRVNYEDRSHADIPIVYGEDVRDWWFNDDAKGVSRGKVAWQGKNALSAQSDSRVRLYLGTWKNPHPEKSIASIDYSSTMTAACPFLVAITVER